MSLENLIKDAELGEAAREFLESDLGKSLLDRAEDEIRSTHLELECADPRDEVGIQKLQNHIQVARWFETWLIEFIDRGQAALEIFKHESEK